MDKDAYEIYLLEIRQVLKEAKAQLKSQASISLSKFHEISQLQASIQKQLILYRTGIKDQNQQVISLMEG
jgi:hypothetical protein